MVIGLARSGIAAAEFLARRGASVVATDTKSEGELPGEALALRERGVRLELGGHRRETFTGATMVVVSPGVPWELPELEAARAAGVPVIAEIELAFRHLAGRVAAITGTKGKTTTTAALGAMLREAGFDARVGGNIGAPLVGLVEGSTEATTFAVEVSSFQLEGTVRFHPHVAVWLNLSPDHLDRHPSLGAYVAAKARVFANQGPGDWAVVNADDPVVLEQARAARARKLLFRVDRRAAPVGRRRLLRGGPRPLPARRAPGDALPEGRGGPARGAPPRRPPRRGGGGAAPGGPGGGDRARGAGLPRCRARARARGHDRRGPVLQRLEGHERRGRAPQPGGLHPAGPVVLGGRYKGGDFGLLAPELRTHGRRVLAIGEARDRVKAALEGAVPVDPCSSLRDAVERAHAAARPGDVVLLAPACSSFDMFADYADRGRAFKAEVRRLAEALRG